jgi:hypothetical protein
MARLLIQQFEARLSVGNKLTQDGFNSRVLDAPQ